MFVNNNQTYEVYARDVYSSDLYGFIEIEELVFGERTQVVVDPAEEKLKAEFEGVKRSFVPMHSVIRIDEVEKQGVAKISDVSSNSVVKNFPMPAGKPPRSDV